MANYTIVVGWSGKDALADSSAEKVISGADFNTEFTAVQTAVNTKADLNGSASEAFSATTATEGTNTTQVATTAFVETATSAANIANAVYPVGAIFTTVTAYANSAAVVAVIGGTTWVAFGAGKVLVGVDTGDSDFNTIEETGGAKTVTTGSTTLTAAQMNHFHGIGNGVNNDDQYTTGRSWSGGAQGTSGSHYVAGEAGGTPNSGSTLTSGSLGSTNPILNSPTGHTHPDTSTVQPYITVYFWKRTA